MFMKYIFLIVLLFSVSSHAAKYTFDECVELSNGVNADTPLDLNNGFILDYSTCMDLPDGPRLIYLYRVGNSISKNQIGPQYANNVRSNLCANSQFVQLLSGLKDVQYQYYNNSTGKYLTSFEANINDCN